MTKDYHLIEAEASENLGAIRSELEALDLGGRSEEIYRSTRSRIHKFMALNLLANKVNALVSPACACREGCSHCCNMAVSVNIMEARAIGKASGRDYVPPSRDYFEEEVAEDRDKYTGVPCPFLDENKRCMVYEVRPMACRTYFNLSNTSSICDLATPQTTPALDTRAFAMTQVLVLGTEYQDIRDWFPTPPKGE